MSTIPWTREEMRAADEAVHAANAYFNALAARKLAAEAHTKITAAISLIGPIANKPGGEDRRPFFEKLLELAVEVTKAI